MTQHMPFSINTFKRYLSSY